MHNLGLKQMTSIWEPERVTKPLLSIRYEGKHKGHAKFHLVDMA